MNEILEIGGYRVALMQSQPGSFSMIMLYAKEKPGVWYRIFFSRDEIEPSYSQAGEGVIIHSPRSSYEPTLDLLRNEKPIYLHVCSTGCVLNTSREPVGEGELSP